VPVQFPPAAADAVATPPVTCPLPHVAGVVILPDVLAAGHVTLPGAGVVLSHSTIIAACQLATVDLNSAILALCRALFKLTRMIEARIPMIAITINNSIKVKPFIFFIFHPPFYFSSQSCKSGFCEDFLLIFILKKPNFIVYF
jgi:hypothetical protein